MSREYEPAEIYLDLRGQALALTRELLDPETRVRRSVSSPC